MDVVHTLFAMDEVQVLFGMGEVNEMIGVLICLTKAQFQIWAKWAHKYSKNTVLSSFRIKLFLMKTETGS